MSRRPRRGFTLVELLVVITIIGMLMGLLLPALSAIRGEMQRTQCASNQRNIALALLRWEGANRCFPGFTNRVGPSALPLTLSAGNTTERCIEASWVVSILADLDRPDLWDVWSKGTDYKAVAPKTADEDRNKLIRILTCPSNPPERQGVNDTPLAFVVNCGAVAQGAIPPNPPEAYGVFHDRGFNGAGNTRVERGRVSLEYIHGNDGEGQTLLLSENVNSGSWAQTNQTRWLGTYQGQDLLGFCWYWTEATHPVVNHINLDIRRNDKDDKIKTGLHARPSSWHHGGVNVVFCDGRGHWLRQDIDPQVYWHLMTPNSRACKPTGSQIILGTLSEMSY